MILAQRGKTETDQSPLGRTVQLRRMLHKDGRTQRMGDRQTKRYSSGKRTICLLISQSR